MVESTSFHEITIILKIVPEDLFNADYALIDAVGRDAVNELRQDNYHVEPIDSHEKGGSFLVAVTMFVSTTADYIWTNKEAIVADLSGLVAIFTSAILPLVKKLRQTYEKRVSKEMAAQFPVKFTFEMEEMQIQIEIADLEDEEKVLQLAQRIHAHYTGMKSNTMQSKLKASVAAKPKRKRR